MDMGEKTLLLEFKESLLAAPDFMSEIVQRLFKKK